MNAIEFSQFLTASVILTLSPGPDIIYVLITSLRHGFRTAFFLAFGLCSGLIVHTTLVGLGLAQFIAERDWALLIVKIFGAFYMLFLAWSVKKSPAEISFDAPKNGNTKKTNIFVTGIFMNVLNPKVSLFFLAFLPQFIRYEAGSVFEQSLVLGAIFFVQGLFIFSAVAYFSGLLHRKIKNNETIGSVLKWTQVLLFLVLAIAILLF